MPLPPRIKLRARLFSRESPIGCLHADALGEIFDFLNLDDLHHALAVSRSWSTIIRSSMPCARFLQSCIAESVVEMGSSALARHITDIIHSAGARCKLTSDALYILAFAMPQLIALRCDVIPSVAIKMILPAKLTTLELDLSALDADGINPAVEAIGQLAALSTLTLTLSSWPPEVSFEPLSKCAALDRLIIKQPPRIGWSAQPTDTHIEQVRGLHHLRSAVILFIDGASLTKLLRTPHSLQWTELWGLSDFAGVCAAALRNLPSLLVLHMSDCCDVSFLPALSQLQDLTLGIEKLPSWAVTADAIVESLSCCRRLTFLSLVAPVASKHLALMLPQLPRLQSLLLLQCSELESLSFLSSVVSLQRTLRALVLDRCSHPALVSSELRHVETLKQLTILSLSKSFADPLDGATQHLLTPPSSVLPALTLFKYTPADPGDSV